MNETEGLRPWEDALLKLFQQARRIVRKAREKEAEN